MRTLEQVATGLWDQMSIGAEFEPVKLEALLCSDRRTLQFCMTLRGGGVLTALLEDATSVEGLDITCDVAEMFASLTNSWMLSGWLWKLWKRVDEDEEDA